MGLLANIKQCKNIIQICYDYNKLDILGCFDILEFAPKIQGRKNESHKQYTMQ